MDEKRIVEILGVKSIGDLSPLQVTKLFVKENVKILLENYRKEYCDIFLVPQNILTMDKDKNYNSGNLKIKISLKRLCRILKTTEKKLPGMLEEMSKFKPLWSRFKEWSDEDLGCWNRVGVFYAKKGKLEIAKYMFKILPTIYGYNLPYESKDEMKVSAYITFPEYTGHYNLGIIDLIESKYESAMKKFKYVENLHYDPVDLKPSKQIQNLTKGIILWTSILHRWNKDCIDPDSYYNWYRLFDKAKEYFEKCEQTEYGIYLDITKEVGKKIVSLILQSEERIVGEFFKELIITNRYIDSVIVSKFNIIKESPVFPILHAFLQSLFKLEEALKSYLMGENVSLSLSFEKDIIRKHNLSNWLIVLDGLEKLVKRINVETPFHAADVERIEYVSKTFKDVSDKYRRDIRDESGRGIEPFSEERLKHIFGEMLIEKYSQERKETEKKKLEYEIWVPNKDYAGCTKLESLDEEDLEKKFEGLKQNYKLLIDDRYNTIYIDGEEINEIEIHRLNKDTKRVKHEPVVIKFARHELLLWFLKNKDILFDSDRLYRVGWSHVWGNMEVMDLPKTYKESVKNEISILNAVFKAGGLEKHLKIDSERLLGYRCIGDCDYCLILKSGHTP